MKKASYYIYWLYKIDVSDWEKITAVFSSMYHIVGLKSDGTVLAAGDNTDGKCNVEDCSIIVAVSAGTFCTVGLKSNGKVVATGTNEYGECNVSNWKNVIAMISGVNKTIELKSDGTVKETNGQNNFYSAKLFKSLATLEQTFAEGKAARERTVAVYKQQSEEDYSQLRHLRESNLCQHCGGRF